MDCVRNLDLGIPVCGKMFPADHYLSHFENLGEIARDCA